MNVQGHLLFAASCTLIARRYDFLPELSQASLWLSLPAALLGALLPDLDHPGSMLGRRLKFISVPLSKLFGHRGFTHSLLAVMALMLGLGQLSSWQALPSGVADALLVGYLSHLLGDMFTPAGVQLLCPAKPRISLALGPLCFKSGSRAETLFCLASLLLACGVSGYLPSFSALESLWQAAQASLPR
ncbi:MAG: metal-dependent hydrolase [Aeromonas sp.]